MDVLIANPSQGRVRYVVPLTRLGEAYNLPVHDRVVQEKLLGSLELSPLTVRRIRLQAAATGIAGAAARRKARTAIREDRNQWLKTLVQLMRATVEQLAPPERLKGLDLNMLATPMGQKLASGLIQQAAGRMGIKPAEVLARVEAWSRTVAPIGSPDGRCNGYIRTTCSWLEHLADGLRVWATYEDLRFRQLVSHFAAAALETAAFVRQRENEADSLGGGLHAALDEWHMTRERLRTSVLEAAWALDGWEPLIEDWRRVERGTREEQRTVLLESFQNVPLLPRDTVEPAREALWVNIGNEQKRWVAERECWKTGEIYRH